MIHSSVPKPLPLLALAAWLAAAAEYLLTLRPRLIELPPTVESALAPVWPHPGPVVAAIACLAVAAVLFIAADRSFECDSSVTVRRNAAGPFGRRTIQVLIGGLVVWAWVIVRLSVAPTDLLAPGLLLVALVLIVGSLTRHEWKRLTSTQTAWRLTRVGWLELLWVLASLSLFTYVMTFDLNSWYYSTIGDEHAFFLFSKELALGQGGRSLFAQDGAYGIIPVLGSYLEAVQMHVFGVTGFGWKIATITPVVLALAATYGLARTLSNRRVALLTLGLLATSHYLFAYGHSGYPNLEPLFPGVLAPLLFVLGVRRSSMALLVASGVIAGLGWYTYYTSRTTIVILAAATLVMVKPRSWAATTAPLAVGFGLMLLPLFAVSKLEVLYKMFEQTGSGPTTEVAANRAMLPVWNMGRSLLAFNYNTHDGPWLTGSLVDPLTGALFVIGLVSAVVGWRAARNRMLLVWFAIGLMVTGILSKYDYVSVSRLSFVLPSVGLFAGIAAERVVRLVEEKGPPQLSRYVFPAALVGCTMLAAWGNLHRWFVETPGLVPTTSSSVAIRIVEDARCQTAMQPPVIVDVGIGGAILPALEALGPRVRPDFGLYSQDSFWIETADSRCVIFRSPHDPPAQAMQQALARRWPTSVPVRECDRSGQVDVVVYYPTAGPTSGQASLPCRSG